MRFQDGDNKDEKKRGTDVKTSEKSRKSQKKYCRLADNCEHEQIDCRL